jgi:hypothetical protein
MFFDIVQPEVITLGVGIGNARATDAFYLRQQRPVAQSRLTQLGPLPPAATRDHVVDGGQGETLMVEVTMQHGEQLAGTVFDTATLTGAPPDCNTLMVVAAQPRHGAGLFIVRPCLTRKWRGPSRVPSNQLLRPVAAAVRPDSTLYCAKLPA